MVGMKSMRDDNQPLLIVIAGPNGSGKSTITERLKQKPEFPERYINADDIKKIIFRMPT